ncbi:MAG: adenylate/guanylate cyclase domain-containing protein [Candidatus Aminicenantes bacterium]|nr:adenylate/guanylate cyclase domain-containing protein [Candidatus Aminicenantes bacterium]
MRRFLLSTALLFIFTISLSHVVTPLFEKKIYDQKIRIFSRHIDAPVILVEIDQESLDFYSKNFNLPWPWPRSLYAKAIDFLSAAGAKAVALDMVFSESSPYGGEDEQLAAAIKKAGIVFIPLFFSDNDTATIDLTRFASPADPGFSRLPVKKGTKSLPLPQLLAELRGSGNVAENPDQDGIYRRLHHFIRFRDRFYPSFSLALALFADPGLAISGIPFADDGGLNLKFYSLDSYQRYSISELIQSQVHLEEGQKAFVPIEKFKDKIVLIGATAPGLLDNRPSPVNAAGAGFDLHATALCNFLARDFIRVLPAWLQWALVFLAIAALNGLLFRIKSIYAQVLAAVAVILLALAANFLIFKIGLDLDFFPFFLGLVLTTASDVYERYRRVRREKKFIQNAFKNYLSDSLLAEIMKNPQGLNLGGEKKLVTIFFSDLAGFTSLSENLPPEEVVTILNTYLERMTTVIMDNGGFVNKFEGDAIMAFWGAPLASSGQASKAMLAALRCQEELAELNNDFASRGLPRLGMRIGINSGEVIVGNIGSRKRFEYTVIGDAVNLASRLEGINKQYGTTIICGALAGSLAAEKVLLRRLDRVRVKGKKIPEEIFQVVAEKEKAPAGSGEQLAKFEKGLHLYLAGDFAAALDIFIAEADDPPARVFAKRCLVLRDNPPVDWDGCWTFTEK